MLERTTDTAQIVRFDFTKGVRYVLLNGHTGIPTQYPALKVTPFGRRLFVSRADQIESELVLADPIK